METDFTVWASVMFTFNVLIAIVSFGFMQCSQKQILERLQQQAAHQDTIWRRLFTKADNTGRLTQEILTRLASDRVSH
jgi:hypothetical protein